MDIKTKFKVGDEIHFMSGKTPKCLKVEAISIFVHKTCRVDIEYFTEGEPMKKSRFGDESRVYVKKERFCFATREECIAAYTAKI